MDLTFGGQGQTTVVNCPRAMVGRVIGKGGETIKALQQYTGASIQIDQSFEPTAVTISGQPSAVNLAQAMVQDIVNGSFKGFAMLRQMVLHAAQAGEGGLEAAGPLPVYIEGYGFVPPTQFYSPEELASAKLQGLAGYSAAVPRTPPSRSASQRGMAIPGMGALGQGGLAGTPPGYEPVLAGSPDISQIMSSLRLGEPGAAGALGMGASPATELWAAEAGIERGLGGAGPVAAGGGLQGAGGSGSLHISGAASGSALHKISSGAALRRIGSASAGLGGGEEGGGLGGADTGSPAGSFRSGGALGAEAFAGLASATRGETLAGLAGLAASGCGTPRSGEAAVGLAGLSGLGTEGIASLAAATATESLMGRSPLQRDSGSSGRASGGPPPLSPLVSGLEPTSPPRQPGLPPGWKQIPDPDGRTFYYNTLKGRSQWEKPD